MYNAFQNLKQSCCTRILNALLWAGLPFIMCYTHSAYSMREKLKKMLNINPRESSMFLQSNSAGEPLGSNDTLSQIIIRSSQDLSDASLTRMLRQAQETENAVLADTINNILKQREHVIVMNEAHNKKGSAHELCHSKDKRSEGTI